MVRQIAVILGAINLDNQKKLLEGMEVAAKEANCNLFVFTNYVGTRETPESVMAASQILKLPDFEKFDGVILAANTIHNPQALDLVVQGMQESKKPLVSIDRHFDGMSCVEIYSYDAEYEMVEHFLYHGYTNIIYVAGPVESNREAQLRLLAYRDALRINGIEFREENVYEGQFTLESGVEVAKQILAEGKRPEAIICANDDMAHGVMKVFKRAGFLIPEDVKIAGFDNGEMSRLNKPSLTTVDKSQYQVGYKAVREIIDLLAGKDIESYRISCKMEYRESCGCKKEESSVAGLYESIEMINQKYIEQQYDTLWMSDVVRGMTGDFSKVHTSDGMIDVLKEYIPQLGINKFYLCLCDREKVFALPERNLGQNIDILHVNEDYTTEMEVPLAYENGVFEIYDKFPKGFVLPENCRSKSGGNTFVVNQIYYQNCCYGYAVCQRVESVVASGLYYSMLMEIGIGLENVRKWMLLNDAVDKLNDMWCYDNLTYLYNRSGFFFKAKDMMDHFREEDKNVFIIFMDADGLKKANDTLGHEVGDLMIREIGSIVHKNVSGEMLGMRYGGDEFVLFGGYKDNEEYKLNRILESIREDMKEVNDSGKHPFVLSASVGVSKWKAREIASLGEVIEQADQKMYAEKRAKKLAAAQVAEK